MERRQLVSVITLLFFLILPGQAETALQPERTHVIMVGVLDWASPQIPPFSKQGRQDLVFYESLLDRGIPASQVAYLHGPSATKQQVALAFSHLSERTQPGDTLLFYYTGHGTNWGDVVRFYEYDAAPNKGISMGEIAEAIKENFKGTNVLLFADCCFSGGLSQVAKDLKNQGFRAASLSSAKDDALSGPTWTYTMSLTDCFRGLRSPDSDLNHKVTLVEARDEIQAALANTQRQVMNSSFQGLSPEFALSYVTSINTIPRLPEPFHAFDYGRLRFKGAWRGVRLMDSQDGLVSAQIQEYASRPAAWLPLQAVRPNRSAPDRIEGKLGERQASVDGRYQDLLARIEVEHDHLDYGPLHQSGPQTLKVYGQFENLPPGHWVYLYPYWYIWSTDNESS